jgi:peptidyl-prolyl cis-trans isomerase C
MKRNPSRILLLLLSLALPCASVMAQETKAAAGKAVATVNGKPIPQSRFDVLLAQQKAQGTAETDELKKQIKEELVRREILAQEATKKGMDKKTDIVAQMDMARQSVLISAYLQEFVKTHPISDEQLKKEYDEIVKQMGSKEYKARHVLVDKEEDAVVIIEKLKKGEKIDDLAKQSKDPGSKDKGGDLGWAVPANYVKPFAEALTGLQKGKFTEKPVKSDFGYHVILLEDVRDMKLPSFDEAKPGLTQRMQQQQVQNQIMELRKAAKIQ